jgi:SulP family sulfate permease
VKIAIAEWGSSYERSWLKGDLIAGITVSAVLIPSALAYAGIVGVEPIVGLYTVPLALVAYAIFGGSRLLVVGPDAAISVLAATTIAGVAGGDDYLDAMIALSLIVGAIYVVFALLKMGWVADLVPEPVLRGFIQGLVWVTILGQVPSLLGVELIDAPSDFWRKAVAIAREVGNLQTETAVLGVGSLLVLFLLRRWAPRIPGALVVLAGTLMLVGGLGLANDGVAVVGEPSGGLFGFGLPTGLTASQLVGLLPGALAIVVLGFTESIGAASSAAQKTGERLDADQELMALGASNVAAGVSGGYVVAGALSKTSVAISSGGRTQVGNLFAALLAVLATLVLRPLFEDLAQTVLAALIIFAMAGMLNVGYFRRLWHIRRREFLLALAAFLGVLTFGVLPGVMIGVILALVLLVEDISRPPSNVLGRTPDGTWHNPEIVVAAKPVEGLVVWRQEAPIIFLNARVTADRLRRLATEGVEVIVADASAVSAIDSTGFGALVTARGDLRSAGVELWVVNPSIRKHLERERVAKVLGVDLPRVYESVGDAVAEFERGRSPS